MVRAPLSTPQCGMFTHALSNSFISTYTVWRPGKSHRGVGRKKKISILNRRSFQERLHTFASDLQNQAKLRFQPVSHLESTLSFFQTYRKLSSLRKSKNHQWVWFCPFVELGDYVKHLDKLKKSSLNVATGGCCNLSKHTVWLLHWCPTSLDGTNSFDLCINQCRILQSLDAKFRRFGPEDPLWRIWLSRVPIVTMLACGGFQLAKLSPCEDFYRESVPQLLVLFLNTCALEDADTKLSVFFDR